MHPKQNPLLRLLTVALMGLYVFLLHYSYRVAVSPDYGYQGLKYREPDSFNYFLAVILTCGLAALLPQRLRKPSDFIQWIMFILTVAPTILVPQYSQILTINDARTLAFVTASCALLIRILSLHPPRQLLPRRLNTTGQGWIIVSIALSISIYLILIISVGVSLDYLSFSNVYSVREDFGSATASIPFMGYLLGLQSNVLNPLFMARGIFYRERALLALGTIGQVVLYTTTGHKSTLMSIVAIAGLALAVRKLQHLSAPRFIAYATSVLVGCLAIDAAAGSKALTGLIIRRVLIFPGILSAAYVSVFQPLTKVQFTDVIAWKTSPYDTPPSYIVGRDFFGSFETNANAAWIGHGYASLGYLGVLIEALLIVVLLWLADESTKDLPMQIGALIFVIPAMSLASASVTTVIITHGFAAAIIVAWSLPRDLGQAAPKRQTSPTIPSEH
jgi:hypothetical protein